MIRILSIVAAFVLLAVLQVQSDNPGVYVKNWGLPKPTPMAEGKPWALVGFGRDFPSASPRQSE
jgi:hypothetical protein